MRLSEALEYATRAVARVAAETMNATIESARPEDYARMRSLAACWDTLGWIDFRLGNTAPALRNVEASWLLWQRAVVGEHLSEIYENLGKKNDADRVCRIAFVAPGIDEEPQLKEKLFAMQKRLGVTPVDTSALEKTYRAPAAGGIALSEIRAWKVPADIRFPDGAKSAIFAITTEDTGLTHAQFVNGDNVLQTESKFVEKITFQRRFPDETHVRIFRKGLLSCSKYSKGCVFVAFVLDDAVTAIRTTPD